jgi:hypothetical protein
MRAVLIFLTLIFFSGCAVLKPDLSTEDSVAKYPTWYTSVHKDSSVNFYGLGEGSTKTDAISAALNDIASKISISVESTYITKTKIITKDEKEDYTQIIDNHIKNEVAKIEFNRYELLKYEKLNNDTHIVMVSLNRIKSAEFKSQKVKNKIDSYKKELSNNSSNTVAKLKVLNEISDEIDTKTLPQCYIIKTLYPLEENDEDIKTLLDIKNSISTFKEDISFNIDGTSGFKEVLQEKISAKAFSIVKRGEKVRIGIKADETQLYVMGNNIYKAKVDISVYADNKILGKKTLTIGAKSRTSYKQAKEFALIEFRERLKEQNVLKELAGI